MLEILQPGEDRLDISNNYWRYLELAKAIQFAFNRHPGIIKYPALNDKSKAFGRQTEALNMAQILYQNMTLPISSRYPHSKHRPFPFLTFHQNLPAHHLTVIPANCQPQSIAAVLSRG